METEVKINYDHELLDKVYDMYRKERIGYNKICEQCRNIAENKGKKLKNGPVPIYHIGKDYRKNNIRLLVIGTVADGWNDKISDFAKSWNDVFVGNNINWMQDVIESRVKELFFEQDIKFFRYLNYALTEWFGGSEIAFNNVAITNYVHCNMGIREDYLPQDVRNYCANIENNGFFVKEIEVIKPTHIIGLAKPSVTKYSDFLYKQLDREKWNYINIEHPSSRGRSLNGFKNEVIEFLNRDS